MLSTHYNKKQIKYFYYLKKIVQFNFLLKGFEFCRSVTKANNVAICMHNFFLNLKACLYHQFKTINFSCTH